MDKFTRQWIIENAQKILLDYSGGITIRQLHYRLVAMGMTNDTNHYKRVVGAMTKARWDGTINMNAFIDRERTMFGVTEDETKDLQTEIEQGKDQINAWMNAYDLNRWSNQENYIEIGIEKKALQGVFEDPCRSANVGLAPFKGYSSITFLHEAVARFEDAVANDKVPIILYFGDYDPSGLDIPRSIRDNLNRMGVDVEVKRIALNPDQIHEMDLPGVPAKLTDSRTNNWLGGKVVECDAVEPITLAQMCRDAIDEHFNQDLYNELKDRESDEGTLYRKALKDYVLGL